MDLWIITAHTPSTLKLFHVWFNRMKCLHTMLLSFAAMEVALIQKNTLGGWILRCASMDVKRQTNPRSKTPRLSSLLVLLLNAEVARGIAQAWLWYTSRAAAKPLYPQKKTRERGSQSSLSQM